MRLLNTHTLELEEFVGDPEEPYAILSHRWGDEEVTFKEYRKTRETVKHRAGYKKIIQFCKMSRQRGFRLAWIDTCCIDKRSSAELSEAINSMYKWYGRSAECYVWLEDYSGNLNELHKCAWFNRGWTLQELLAPRRVLFFTARWNIIGHNFIVSSCLMNLDAPCACRENPTQSQLVPLGPHITPWLTTASRIPERYLKNDRVGDASIAERMSWASQRITTRAEDRAYSLMGLFSINMPLLYGEGKMAFQRLQEEIVRKNDDSSIFCHSNPFFSLLAHDPVDFINCGGFKRGHIPSSEPCSLTNRGLRLFATARKYQLDSFPLSKPVFVYRIDLGCEVPDSSLTAHPTWPNQYNTRGAQYIYVGQDERCLFHKIPIGFEDISQAVRRNGDWEDVSEMVFFIQKDLTASNYREQEPLKLAVGILVPESDASTLQRRERQGATTPFTLPAGQLLHALLLPGNMAFGAPNQPSTPQRTESQGTITLTSPAGQLLQALLLQDKSASDAPFHQRKEWQGAMTPLDSPAARHLQALLLRRQTVDTAIPLL